MLVGEAPGRDEDQAGTPFVGRAGEVLDELLNQAGIDRSEIFITNAVRCWPHRDGRNRTPSKAEILACQRNLALDIAFMEPKVIVTLGNVPLWSVLNDFTLRITKAHGRIFKHKNIPVLPTYHPASFLYQGGNTSDRVGEAIADLRKAQSIVQGEASALKKASRLIEIEDWEADTPPLKAKFIGFDLEWTGEHPWAEDAKIVCASVSAKKRCVYFPPKKVKHFLRYLCRCSGFLTGHAISNDLLWLLVHQCRTLEEVVALAKKPFCDTLILTHLWDHRVEPKTLKHLCETKVGVKLVETPWRKGDGPLDVPKAKLRVYNCSDSWGGTVLARWLSKRLNERQARMAQFLSAKLMRSTTLATFAGMKIDQAQLRKAQVHFGQREKEASETLKRLAPALDLSSSDAILNHVFGTLDLPVLGYVQRSKWGKKPEWATPELWDEDRNRPCWARRAFKPKWNKMVKAALTKLDKTGFVDTLVKRDRARKFRTTYLENIAKLIRPDGCLHPRFVLTKQSEAGEDSDVVKGGTRTGRPIMVEPSFQTFPTGEDGKPIRDMIVSHFKNGWLLGWDYKQIELYVGADLSGCERMINAFIEGSLDYHTLTAAELFGVKYKNVTPEQRARGKTCNFAIIFGCEPAKLVMIFAQYGVIVPLKEAKRFHRTWYRIHPEIEAWQERTKEFVVRHGYVDGPTGQREYIYAGNDGPEGRKGLRRAINMPIQNGAAVLANAGFDALQMRFTERPYLGRAFVLGHVYDQIVEDVQDRVKKLAIEDTQAILTDAERLVGPLGWHLRVPIRVELKEGRCLQ